MFRTTNELSAAIYFRQRKFHTSIWAGLRFICSLEVEGVNISCPDCSWEGLLSEDWATL